MPNFRPIRVAPNTARAEAAGVAAELLSQTGSKHGILSATFAFNGAGAEALAQRWLGTLQWIGNSPVRPKHPRKNWYIGVFRLPQIPALPDDDSIHFETCRAGGKGGQHVNKTDSAVRATHLATGVSVRVESERSQHANKKRARELLAIKLAAQAFGSAGATRKPCARAAVSSGARPTCSRV